MIFDADVVRTLVVDWQRTKSCAVLERIYDGTNKLIEAIVSYYDPIYRDDMIQECRLKLISGALQGYDSAYSLHTYLTTVFHNCCRTYMKKQYRISNLLDEDAEPLERVSSDSVSCSDMIEDAICRNRDRFPSIPTEVVDDMTEYIITRLSGNIGKKRGLVAELMANFCMSRHVATTVYHSTIIYLRGKYDNGAKISKDCSEFSLMPDLREELGDGAVQRLIIMFSGVCIRVP